METNGKLVGTLNTVVRINNDRQDGYQLAARQTNDSDLKNLFAKFSSESSNFRNDLVTEVNKLNGDAATDTTLSGKVFRAWMEVKKAVTAGDEHAILASCEFGEDAAQKAYREALASDAEIDADTRQLITDQQAKLKTAHDLIKKYRDAHKAMNN